MLPETVKKKGNGIAFGDLHAPAMHPLFPKFLKAMVKKWNVKWSVCTGDIVTQHLFSTHVHEVDAENARDELASARKQIKQLADIFPKMILIFGNHDKRHAKRCKEVGLPEEILKSWSEIYGAPDSWSFYELVAIENHGFKIICEHGEIHGGDNGLRKCLDTFGGYCYLSGHLHGLGGAIVWKNNGFQLTWAANVGCGVDTDHADQRYGKKSAKQGVRGCQVIVDGRPIFESFDLWLESRKS